MKRVIAIMMIIAMVLYGMPSVYAEDYSQDNNNEENSVTPNDAVILPGLIEDPTGTLVLYFSAHFNNVETHHNTYRSGKMIHKNTFPGATIYLKGILNHTYANDNSQIPKIRLGIGKYIAGNASCYPDFYTYPTPGSEFFVELCNRSSLNESTNYNLYLDNYYEKGYVNGDVGAYYIK